MRITLIIMTFISTSLLALTDEEMAETKQRLFNEHKAQKIEFINQQLTSLERKKACLDKAKNHNDISSCQKKLKMTMREVRKDTKVKVKKLRAKRKEALKSQ